MSRGDERPSDATSGGDVRDEESGGRRSRLAPLRAAAAHVAAHPRHVVLAGLVAGLLLGPLEPRLVVLAAVCAAVLARRPGVALLAAAAALGGGLLADARLEALDRSRLGPVMGAGVAVEVTLLEQPRRSRPGPPRQEGAAPRPPGRRALVELRSGPAAGERVVLRAAGEVPWPRAATGVVLAVRGRLEPLRSFDTWQRRRGAHGVLRAERITSTGARRGGLAGRLDAVRGRAERALATGLPPPQAALNRGMVLGQDEALAERTREEFRRAGLAHLLAASGQNVMLLALLALPVLAAAGLGLRARLAGVLLLVALYVPLAGGGASIQRAGVMGAAGLVAGMAGRPASRWYAVLLAAAVTLALNPRAAGDPGWQLSFAAVVAILALAPRMSGVLEGRGVPRAAADVAAITVAATLGTAPLIAHHFERVSLVSLPANLLAAPAVAPVMWLGFLGAAAGQVWEAPALVLNALNGYLLAYLGALAHAAAELPVAEASVALPTPLAVAATYAALAGACAGAASAAVRRRVGRAVRDWPLARAVRDGPLGEAARRAGLAGPGGRSGRRLLAAALAAAAVLVGVLVLASRGDRGVGPPPPGTLRLSFLDVGQGDATLLQRDGRAVLVDAGPPAGGVVERLEEAGVTRLDALVVTHQSADHDGGAAAVLERFPVGTLVDAGVGPPTPPRRALLAAAAARRVPRLVPDAGEALGVGPLRLEVLHPPRTAPPATDPNDRALVLLARDGPFEALLPADAESNVTAGLDLPPVEVVKVAHHGSEDPGLPALLARLRPRIAVIPVGRNTYGHPTNQALTALTAVPDVRRTDRDGTVRIDVRAGRMEVSAG